MPVNFTSVKAVPCITAGMCACTYISFLVPVPCSSDLLMPDHQVRTVLLLRNTPYSQFYWNGKKKMCGYGVDMEYPLVAGEQKRKLVAAHNIVQSISFSWIISHPMLYFSSSFMVPQLGTEHEVSSPRLCLNWLTERFSWQVRMPSLHLCAFPSGACLETMHPPASQFTCRLWAAWEQTHLTTALH